MNSQLGANNMITLRPTNTQLNSLIADYGLIEEHHSGITTYTSKCDTLRVQLFARLKEYSVVYVNPAMLAVINDNNYLEII